MTKGTTVPLLLFSLGPVTRLLCSWSGLIVTSTSMGQTSQWTDTLYQGGQSACYLGLARVMADTPQGCRLREVLIDGV